MNYFKFDIVNDNIVVELNLTYKRNDLIETIETLVFPLEDIDSIQKELSIKFDFNENVMQVENIDELLKFIFEGEVI